MQRKIITLAFGGLFAFVVTAAAVAQGPPFPTAAQAQAAAAQVNPDSQLQKLTSELNLTTDQQTQVKALLVTNQQKLQTVAQDETLSVADRRTQAKTIAESTHTSIKALLTAEQQKKFDAMEEGARKGPFGHLPAPPGGSGS